MAQIIDLGKLRFNFAGDYSNSTTYESNDVVRYGGNVYVYSNLVRTSGNLPTDTNYWALMVEGVNFEGVWSSLQNYQIGDLVAHGGVIYLATADSIGQTPPNVSYWSVYTQGFQFEGVYDNSTQYQKNDIVTYGGQTYIANTDTTATLPTVTGTWNKLAAGLSHEGTYSNTTAYVPGDIVNYGSNVYRNILESTGTMPPANTNWSLLVSGSNYRAGWQGTSYYKIGDSVTLGGNLYKALADNHNAEPSLNGSLWQLQVPGINNRGDWATGQTYFPNEVIKHGGRTLLVNSSHVSNTYIINDINAGRLTSFSDGIRFRGEWTAGTNYLDNDVVIFTPNLYIANTDHTANSDFNVDRSNNGYWEQLVAGASGIVPGITAAVDEGKYLKASGANTTVWAHPGAVEKFFFVSNASTANNDIYHGQTADYAFASIKYACQYIASNTAAHTPATIYVKNGTYNEQLPITVPENVTIKGDSLRNTVIQPAAGNDDFGSVPNNKSTMFLLGSGTTIKDVLMKGMIGFVPGSSPDDITTATIGGVFLRLNPASTIIKSPYIDGCTASSTKGIGAIIDGSVNAGVGSMLFHAFTQIHDGGVGFWVKDNGLAEIVSCFTYYAHLGYTTSGGGKIRALNGNNSYGKYGAVSGGFDTTENIVTGKLHGDTLSYVSSTLSNTAGFTVGDTLTVGSTINLVANSMTVNLANTVVTTNTAHGLINGQAFYFDQLNETAWQNILGDFTNAHGRTWYARVYSNTEFGIASNYDATNLFNTLNLAGWGNVTLNISDATRSNPVIVTFTGAHGYSNGNVLQTVSGVVGMTELNGTSHFVQTVNATAVNVFTDSGLSSSLDGTGFGAYVSGGTAIRELVGTSMTGGTIKIPSPTTTIKNIQTNLTDGTHRLVVANTTYGKTGQSYKVNVGKNNANADVYFINGEKTKQLKFYNNRTYIFEQNDITNINKPLVLSSTSGSLTAVPNAFYYLDDVSVNATSYATNFNSATRRYHGITIAAGAAANTYYYLSANSLNVVGNTVTTANASSNVHEPFQRQYIPWNPFWVANTTITAQDGTTARLAGGNAGHRGQFGFALVLKELNEQPRAGGSIQFKTSVTYSPNTNQVLSGTAQETGEEARSFIISTVTGYSNTDGTATITLTQEKQPTSAGYNGQDVHVRYNYSQIRLTGHDFLSIGTGNTVTTNYPGEPTQAAAQGNEVVENLPGRVYYVSTDQDGNFRVGDYFRIDQATGRATLDASAFDLSGLTSLRLGSIGAQIGESINEFSSDATLSDASNIAVPTEAAVKTYVDGEISNLQTSLQSQITSVNTSLSSSITALESSTGFILLSNDFTNTSVQYNSNNQIIAANTNDIGYSNVIYNTAGYITSFTERNFSTNVYQNVVMTYNANNNITGVNATVITP
tara:strand:- start:1757 stop:5950 length:4194 start_codon:yes stop_codon:yes gene_type:complete